MSDVSYYSIVFHLRHVLRHNNILIPCGSNENVRIFDDFFQSNNLKTLHASL